MYGFTWTEEYVAEELDGAQGWVWYNWVREHDVGIWGASEERKGKGYIQQEAERRMAELKATRKNKNG